MVRFASHIADEFPVGQVLRNEVGMQTRLPKMELSE